MMMEMALIKTMTFFKLMERNMHAMAIDAS